MSMAAVHPHNATRRALGVLFVLLGCVWWDQSFGETPQGIPAHQSKQIQDRDIKRDNKVHSRPLEKDRKVWRYVTKEQLDKDKKQGIAAHEHMTSGVRPGHPPNAATAKKQYGLPKPPVAREAIVLPKGQPVKRAKSLGGERGRGEITSSKKLPKSALKATTPLKQPAKQKSKNK